MRLDWEEMALDEREREYSPSSCIGGNYAPFIDDYRRLSAEARAHHAPVTHRYGAAARQVLDLFLPSGDRDAPPLLVFLHGGYWQELSKEESSFAAPHCLARGIAYAAVDYTLAPQASLDAIVEDCVLALDWLKDFAATAGFDAQRIFLAGSSAGAHLAAMVALQRPGLAGAILVSGIYELEPLAGTSIDAALRLSPATIAAMSPLRLDLAGVPPTIVAWGEIETDQAKRQSRALATRLQASGRPCRSVEIAGRNHFDVILDLADPATALGQRVQSLICNGTL